jgi:hypothetical protein
MDNTEADSGALSAAVVFFYHSGVVPNPCQRGEVTYPLDEIPLLAVLAVPAGADSFVA